MCPTIAMMAGQLVRTTPDMSGGTSSQGGGQHTSLVCPLSGCPVRGKEGKVLRTSPVLAAGLLSFLAGCSVVHPARLVTSTARHSTVRGCSQRSTSKANGPRVPPSAGKFQPAATRAIPGPVRPWPPGRLVTRPQARSIFCKKLCMTLGRSIQQRVQTFPSPPIEKS
jgi:hypothetical protein